jgi:hypothetical protein
MFVIISMSLNSIQTITSTTDMKVSQIEQITGQRCRMDAWKISDTSTIALNITNIGENSIRLYDFSSMDIFALYTVNGSDTIDRLQYGVNNSTGDFWELYKVFSNGVEKETVSPMIVASSSGAWDPGETMEILVHILPISGNVVRITFVMPSGFESSLGVANSILHGTATINAGSHSVVVTHNLGIIPTNVQVTPSSAIQSGFWVSEITNKTFTINIASLEDHEVNFYWTVDP